jgi:hypothetical protein
VACITKQPELPMSAATSLVLAPFAALFRLCHARPILAIVISGGAGVLAWMTGHENWMAVLVSFSAYLLIWLDEHEQRAARPPAATHQEDA